MQEAGDRRQHLKMIAGGGPGRSDHPHLAQGTGQGDLGDNSGQYGNRIVSKRTNKDVGL